MVFRFIGNVLLQTIPSTKSLRKNVRTPCCPAPAPSQLGLDPSAGLRGEDVEVRGVSTRIRPGDGRVANGVPTEAPRPQDAGELVETSELGALPGPDLFRGKSNVLVTASFGTQLGGPQDR
jgi:hypothetical protein